MSSCCPCPTPVIILAGVHVNELRRPQGALLFRTVPGPIFRSISEVNTDETCRTHCTIWEFTHCKVYDLFRTENSNSQIQTEEAQETKAQTETKTKDQRPKGGCAC